MTAERFFRLGGAAALLACAVPGWAAEANLPLLTSTPGAGGAQSYSLSLQTLLLLTSLTFLPAVLLMMTSFTRIVIVLSLLRQALGTPAAPPNQVLIGLSLFLTLFVMSPVIDRIYDEAYKPFSENSKTSDDPSRRPTNMAFASASSMALSPVCADRGHPSLPPAV